jgi:hypothetical protein
MELSYDQETLIIVCKPTYIVAEYELHHYKQHSRPATSGEGEGANLLWPGIFDRAISLSGKWLYLYLHHHYYSFRYRFFFSKTLLRALRGPAGLDTSSSLNRLALKCQASLGGRVCT